MKFDHLLKETSRDINTALEEEQKALLAANDKLVEQRLLFEKENNDFGFFLGSEENIVSLNVSGTIMATKRSTLGLYKDSVLANHFGDPLWVQQKIQHQRRSGAARKLPSGRQLSRVFHMMLSLPSWGIRSMGPPCLSWVGNTLRKLV